MKSCVNSSHHLYVDVYFNDAHCLKSVISHLKEDNFSFMASPREWKLRDMTEKAALWIIKGALIDKRLIFHTSVPQTPKEFFQYLRYQDIDSLSLFQKRINKISKQFIDVSEQQSPRDSFFSQLTNKLGRGSDKPSMYSDDGTERFIYTQRGNKEQKKITEKTKGLVRKYFNNKIYSVEIWSLKCEPYCLKLTKIMYFSLVSKYICITNFRLPRNDKEAICSIFNNTQLKIGNFQEMSITSKMNICHKRIIEYIISQKCIRRMELSIIKRSLSSLAFIQQENSQTLITIINNILGMQANNIQKVRIFLILFECFRWVNEFLSSQYNFYSFVNYIHQKCKQFLKGLQYDTMSQWQRKLVTFFNDAIHGQNSLSFLQKINEQFGYKIYLRHAIIDEYQQALSQIILYAFYRALVTNLRLITDISASQFSYGKLAEQQQFERYFNYEAFYLLLDFKRIDRFTKLLCDYGFKVNRFYRCLEYRDVLVKTARHTNIAKRELLFIFPQDFISIGHTQNKHYLFLIVRAKMNFINSCKMQQDKRKDCQQLRLSLFDDFTIQNCMQALGQPSLYYHDHSFFEHVQNFLLVFNHFNLIFSNHFSAKQREEFYERVFYRIIGQHCELCEFYSRVWLKTYIDFHTISTDKGTSFQDTVLQFICFSLKTERSISALSSFFKYFLKITKYLQTPSFFIYDYILLIYRATSFYKSDFSIYFIEEYEDFTQEILLSKTIECLWRTNHEIYFDFIQEYYKFVNTIMYSHYKKVARSLEMVAYLKKFIQKMKDEQEVQAFIVGNIRWFQTRLKSIKTQALASFLLHLHNRLEHQIDIRPAHFIFLWRHINACYPRLSYQDNIYYLYSKSLRRSVQRRRRLLSRRWKTAFANYQLSRKYVLQVMQLAGRRYPDRILNQFKSAVERFCRNIQKKRQ